MKGEKRSKGRTLSPIRYKEGVEKEDQYRRLGGSSQKNRRKYSIMEVKRKNVKMILKEEMSGY